MNKDLKDKAKAFVTALDKCQSTKEVFDLLSTSMDKDTLRDRVGHVNDMVEINNLNDKKARLNIQAGYRVSHGDLAIMAARKYCDIVGDSKNGIRRFKLETNKYLTRKENEKNVEKTQSKALETLDMQM